MIFDMATKKLKKKKKQVKVVYTDKIEPRLVLPFVLLLANKILSLIGFVDFIDRSVEWDPKHWKVSPGNLAKAVILVTFLQIRTPLYKIKNSFIGIDTEALFGKDVMPEHLNDDAIARALDRISEAKPEGLFSTLCLSLYTKFNIAFNRLHSDTTTISFYGAYEDFENAGKDTLKIVKGYNKDHRPECNQVVVGKIVNEHGIAVASSTMDGNTSDVEWNEKALKLVKETFGEKLNQVTYIADSKLINLPIFRQLMDPTSKIRFISRCPANFYSKIASKVIIRAYQDDKWTNAGKIGTGKRACIHQIQEYTESIEGHSVQLIVVRSSAGQKRYQQKLEKLQSQYEKDILDVSKKVFVCEADARKEWQRFEKEHKKSLFKCKVHFHEIKKEKRPVGNPGKIPKPPKVEVTWQICAEIDSINEELLEKFRHEEECFVLITSIEGEELKGIDVLRQYKDQSIVELQFKLLKEPAVASTIFLKTPERIDALMMLLNVSLLIRALVQYKLRKSVCESKEELPRIGWDNRKLENPTIKFVLEALQKTCLVRLNENAYRCEFLSESEKLRVTTILKLLEINIEDFLE